MANELLTNALNGIPGYTTPSVKDKIIYHTFKSLEVYDGDPVLWNNLGACYLMLGANPDSAIYCFTRAISLMPAYPMAHFNMGRAYEFKKDTSKAIDYYLKAIALDSQLLQPYLFLMPLLYARARTDSLMKYATIATNKFPHVEFFHAALGNAFALRNDTAGALSHFEKAFTINPANQKIFEHLYRLYTAFGMKNKADSLYKVHLSAITKKSKNFK